MKRIIKSPLKALNHLQNFPDVKIAFSLSDPGLSWDLKTNSEIESYGLDYIFGNDDEAMAFVEAENIEEAFVKLQKKPYTSILQWGKKEVR